MAICGSLAALSGILRTRRNDEVRGAQDVALPLSQRGRLRHSLSTTLWRMFLDARPRTRGRARGLDQANNRDDPRDEMERERASVLAGDELDSS